MAKKTAKRLTPTKETLIRLFAKSGNRCAFPSCNHPLLDEDNNFIGQVCHIEAAMPGGERFNDQQSDEERRNYNNLLLMCYPHHIKTNDVKKYTVEILKKMKAAHEEAFKEPYQVNEDTIIGIFDDLKTVKEDVTEILELLKEKKQQDETIANQAQTIQILLSNNITVNSKDQHIQEINNLKELRENNHHKVALEQLNKLRQNKWHILSDIEKFKVLINIAICQMDLNDHDNSALNLIEALQYNKEDENALAYASLGYAFIGNKEKSRYYFYETLKKNENNVNAYISFLLIEGEATDFDIILNRIPESIRNFPEITHALSRIARERGNYEQAILWLQKGLENSERRKAEITGTLASIILESITNPFNLVTGQVNQDTLNKVNYSISLLNQAWEEVKDTDLKNQRAWILVNRGIAKKYIRDFEGAYEDIKQAASLSDNDYSTIQHFAIISFETERYEKAIELLNKLKALRKEEINSDLFKAEILYKTGKYSDVLIILIELLNKNPAKEIKEEAESLLIYTHIALKDYEKAVLVSDKILADRPNNIRGYIDTARIFASWEKPEEALIKLKKAVVYIDETGSHADLYELSTLLISYNEYRIAGEILEKITDKNVYSTLSKSLINCYYKAGESGKALKICENLTNLYGPLDAITEVQCVIYLSIDDLENAISICEQHLLVYPDDQLIILRLAVIYGSIQDFTKVNELVVKISSPTNLPLEQQYQLAYLYLLIGQIPECLQIAYLARKNNFNNGSAHLKYFGIFAELRSSVKFLMQIDKVEIDTTVKIKDEFNKEYIFTIVENDAKIEFDELNADEPLASKLLGKTVGDIIEIEKPYEQIQKYCIISILSKYIHASHESINLLQNRFNDVKNFQVFHFSNTGNPKEDFKFIFNTIDETTVYNDQLEELYIKRQITIGTFASLKGKNPIHLWSVVVNKEELGISSIGHPNENYLAYNLINRKKGFIIDIFSLLTLASTESLHLLERLPNEKAVAQSTIDLLYDLIKEFRSVGSEGFLSVGKIKGNYIKHEITKEEVEKSLQQYEALILWCKTHCKILPCNEALNINAGIKAELDKFLGKTFIDSILIAKEKSYLLLSEEENLRAIALQDHNVQGFSSYILFLYCNKIGVVKKEELDEKVVKLISLCYKNIPVDDDILYNAAILSQFKVAYPFSLAIKTLHYSVSSNDSSIIVACNFFRKLYLNNDIKFFRQNLAVAILHILFDGRDEALVAKKLNKVIAINFKFLQLQKDELISVINEFLNVRQKNIIIT